VTNSTISVIVPTIGRDTLERTLDSLLCFNEVIVVSDGHDEDIQKDWSDFGYRYAWVTDPASCVGHAQRNAGMALASCDYIAFCGDDDVMTPGAYDVIQKALYSANAPHIFKVDTWSCGIVWRNTELYEGNIDCGGLVVPNIKPKLGRFTYRYSGDYDFIVETLRLMEKAPVWNDNVIQVCRPERYE